MRITFVLPGIVLEPNGGTKVVYEYANRLSARGHQCCVIHPRTWDRLGGALQQAKARLWPQFIRSKHGGPTPWLDVRPEVVQRLTPDLSPSSFPDADAVVATFFRTAPFVNALPALKGRKYYLIQHYEDWAGPKSEVDATWRLPMHKVVISKWLEEMAVGMQEQKRISHIPNGMDLELFSQLEPIEERGATVAMLASPSQFKGTADGLAALVLVKQAVPELTVRSFGTQDRPTALPDWVAYDQLPVPSALAELYNTASVFLQPSHAEGWGLTSTEAMACGCALVTTDNGGSRDFAIPDETALVTRVGDVQAMADAVIALLTDRSRRVALARAGCSYVQQFTWDRAVSSLESVLACGT